MHIPKCVPHLHFFNSAFFNKTTSYSENRYRVYLCSFQEFLLLDSEEIMKRTCSDKIMESSRFDTFLNIYWHSEKISLAGSYCHNLRNKESIAFFILQIALTATVKMWNISCYHCRRDHGSSGFLKLAIYLNRFSFS